ncbi:hypothetical protein ACJJTC_010315 [Scirpophaga incertulas]
MRRVVHNRSSEEFHFDGVTSESHELQLHRRGIRNACAESDKNIGMITFSLESLKQDSIIRNSSIPHPFPPVHISGYKLNSTLPVLTQWTVSELYAKERPERAISACKSRTRAGSSS